MGFVRSVLAPDEEVVVHVHPHWRALVRPVLTVLVAACLAGVAGGFAEVQLGASARHAVWAVLALAFAWVVLRHGAAPALRWARTDLVVTGDRVLYRPAGARRHVLDVPLTRISAVRFRHTLADRVLGTGALVLERGYHPPVEIADVPRVADVHAALYDEVRAARPPVWRGDDDPL